jgi:uncharacterized protein YndB with AHSA1/START domain
MNASAAAIRVPDLAAEQAFAAQPAALYQAWTAGFDKWFAVPHESDAVAKRHPHYGRFLRLIPRALIEMTWVTGALGTEGSETVVTIKLAPANGGTHLHLTHAGFPNAAARDRHSQAWPAVLTHLAERLTNANTR